MPRNKKRKNIIVRDLLRSPVKELMNPNKLKSRQGKYPTLMQALEANFGITFIQRLLP